MLVTPILVWVSGISLLLSVGYTHYDGRKRRSSSVAHRPPDGLDRVDDPLAVSPIHEHVHYVAEGQEEDEQDGELDDQAQGGRVLRLQEIHDQQHDRGEDR